MFIINPGTEEQKNTTEENAVTSVGIFVKDLVHNNKQLKKVQIERVKARDSKGWYGFNLILGDKKVELDIPGVASDIFVEGTPFKSPRCYVDGSSWLYGFGLNQASNALKGKQS